jgi:ketosteroid isomerase-like protein
MNKHPYARAAAAVALLAATACASAPHAGSGGDPQATLDGLLAADRAFAAASADTDLVAGISAMFAPDVVMPLPNGTFAEGAEAAAASMRETPANDGARAEWAPLRGGISADGQHGFTFGYMTVHLADGTVSPGKYLAYWVRQPAGWRVAVYRRSRRPEGEVSTEMLPPALPARLVRPSTNPATIEAHRASLDAAERAFSDESQTIGLGPAFAKWGSADAMNRGLAASFIIGADSIGASIGAGSPGPSPVSWAPDRVIVASSGDLGVTIGHIRPNTPPTDASSPTSFPFFTIWRRPTPDSPWRYIAE